MVDEAGELRQPLGLGEAVSVTFHKSGKHTQYYEQEPFFLTLMSTQHFCKMPQSSTAESRVQ